jgi:hypothetical protein
MANENTPTPTPLIEGAFVNSKAALIAASAALAAKGVECELSIDSSTSAKGTMSKAEIRTSALSPELYAQVQTLTSQGLKITVVIEDPTSNTGWTAKTDPMSQLKALMS